VLIRFNFILKNQITRLWLGCDCFNINCIPYECKVITVLN